MEFRRDRCLTISIESQLTLFLIIMKGFERRKLKLTRFSRELKTAKLQNGSFVYCSKTGILLSKMSDIQGLTLFTYPCCVYRIATFLKYNLKMHAHYRHYIQFLLKEESYLNTIKAQRRVLTALFCASDSK